MNALLAQAIKGNREAQKIFENMLLDESWGPALHAVMCDKSKTHDQCNAHRYIRRRWGSLR
jgi:hypothetical protein